MSDVKRYDCTNGGVAFCRGCYEMEEVQNGDYVQAEDFDALQTEAQALREEVEALRARVVVPDDLLQRCREILDWQRTGVLRGDALRSLGRSRWNGDPNELHLAENETAREAYRFIDELAHLNGKLVSEGLLRDLLKSAQKLSDRASNFMVSGVEFIEIGDNNSAVMELEVTLEALRALLDDGKEDSHA